MPAPASAIRLPLADVLPAQQGLGVSCWGDRVGVAQGPQMVRTVDNIRRALLSYIQFGCAVDGLELHTERAPPLAEADVDLPTEPHPHLQAMLGDRPVEYPVQVVREGPSSRLKGA